MDDVFIKKVCAGDQNAFRYFVSKYKDMAFSIAMSVVKNEFTTQEIVQDAFVKAFKNLHSFSYQSAFSTWFYRIVVNEALTRLRKEKHEIVEFVAEYHNEPIDETYIASLKKEEQVYLINEALQKLPAKESLVLRLFYLEEESIREVCDITGWSESNTKTLLHRARKNMFLIITELKKTEL